MARSRWPPAEDAKAPAPAGASPAHADRVRQQLPARPARRRRGRTAGARGLRGLVAGGSHPGGRAAVAGVVTGGRGPGRAGRRRRRALGLRPRVRRQRAAARHAAVGGQLRRAPVRQLGRAAGRWPRHLAGRGDRAGRRTPGAAAQGRRAYAVLALRRRPRGAALLDPRVPVQRGHAPPGHPHHARAQPGRHRRGGGAGHVLRRPSAPGTRCRGVPHCARLPALRQLAAAGLARRHRPAAAAGRPRAAPPLPGAARQGGRMATPSGSRGCASAPRGWWPAGCGWASSTG